jgi:hypothetical protein
VLALIGLPLLSNANGQSNITGTYDGQGIYKIENMSVRVVNQTYDAPAYRFIGIIHNISNNTMHIGGVTVQMFDAENNLLDFTGKEQNEDLAPNDKILYKVFGPIEYNENLDHYVVSAVDGDIANKISLPNQSNSNYPTSNEEFYDQCVRVSGESFCDFLFRR